MTRLALVLSLLIGSTAGAQTVLSRIAINRVDDPNTDTYTFGSGACNDTLTLQWSNTLTINLTQCSQNPLKLWATDGECQDTPGTADTRYEDVPALTLSTVRQGTFTVKIAELPYFKTTTTEDGGVNMPCSSPTPFTRTQRVCGSVEYATSTGFGCGTATKLAASPLKLVFDTLPPSAPVIDKADPQDKAVRVAFTVDSDTSTVVIEAKGPSDADFRELAETSSTNGFIRGEKLENNVTYQVHLRAKDAAGNVSDPSMEVSLTPILTYGFFGVYKEAGGTDTGGCSTGAGLVPLLALAFGLRRARKQKRNQP